MALRRKWDLTQEAFDKLLGSLDSDRESAGTKYLELRNNLIRFFEWRGSLLPEEQADETINRVAKRITEGEEVRDASKYSVGVARMLLLEVHKERARERNALRELTSSQDTIQYNVYEFEELGPRVECLGHCLNGLSADNRELILQYYQGDKSVKIENRKRLTSLLKVPLNTLRMRALRLRERLLVCVEDCLKK
jgi:DNA-directed RNA polymerase specialized sigma24 family protein